jgi:hypothetical protein
VDKRTFLAAAGALLLAAGSGRAITVSGLDRDSSSYVVSAGSFSGDYSGLAELIMVRSGLGSEMIEGCSGVPLSDGFSILSATCVVEHDRLTAYVTFILPGGTYTSRAVNFRDPLLDDPTECLNDIAALNMPFPSPEDGLDQYLRLGGDEGSNPFGDDAQDALGGILGLAWDKPGPGDAGDGYRALSAPEPKTMFLVGVALIALSLMGYKRRQR